MWLTGLSSIYIRESKFLVQGAVTATIGTRLENKGLLLQGDQSFNFCIFNVLCSFRVFLLIYIFNIERLPDAATLPQSGASSDSSDDDR